MHTLSAKPAILRSGRLRTCLAAGLLILLLAGCTALPLSPAPVEGPTSPAAETATLEHPTAEPAAEGPSGPTAEPTQVVPTSAPAATPVPGAWSMVTLREDKVFVGDSWGGQERQVLALGAVSGVAWHGTQLAYVADGGILLADLAGGAPRRLADAPPAFLLGPDLLWTADGKALLTIADHEDANAKETGRSIDIGVVNLADGAWRPGLAVADRIGVTVLQAESATGKVLLVAWGLDPSFKEALRYDLVDGQLLATVPMAGEGEIVPSPDGRLALTGLFDPGNGINTSLLYDLTEDSLPLRQRLGLAAKTHTAGHIWSPDGKRVAYLLREGRAAGEESGRGLGLWIWDVALRRTVKAANASDPADAPLAWTPDGRYLIFRQADASGARAVYALALADASIRRLPLDPASRILGWLPVAQ